MPVYKYLKKELSTNIYFYTGEISEEAKNKVSFLKPGEIILIENIRFFKEEMEDDESFSKKLGGLGEIYMNNAFFPVAIENKHQYIKLPNMLKTLMRDPSLKKKLSLLIK